jgi:acyl-CoA dehydrogenase
MDLLSPAHARLRDDARRLAADLYLDARLSRSGPVSNEFALNFIAQHVLGLPAHK